MKQSRLLSAASLIGVFAWTSAPLAEPSSDRAMTLPEVKKIVVSSSLGTWLQVSEVVALDASGTDQAVAGRAIAYGSSYGNGRDGNSPDKAIDEKGPIDYPEIFHSASPAADEALTIEFSSPVAIADLMIFGRPGFGERDVYSVQLLDDVGRELLSVSGQSAHNPQNRADIALIASDVPEASPDAKAHASDIQSGIAPSKSQTPLSRTVEATLDESSSSKSEDHGQATGAATGSSETIEGRAAHWQHSRSSQTDSASLDGVTFVCSDGSTMPPLTVLTPVKNVRPNKIVTLTIGTVSFDLVTPKDQTTISYARASFQGDWSEALAELRTAAALHPVIKMKFPQKYFERETAGLAEALAAFDPACGTPPAKEPVVTAKAAGTGTTRWEAPGFGLVLEPLVAGSRNLRILDLAPGAMTEAGVKPGDIIGEVRRYAPSIETAQTAEEAMRFLSEAYGDQTFQVDVFLQPNRVKQTIRLEAPVPQSGLKLAGVRDAKLLAEIRAGDMKVIRQSENWDRDIRSGRRDFLNGLYVHYHNAFGRACSNPKFGPFTKYTERSDLIQTNKNTNTEQVFQGRDFDYIIRNEYLGRYRLAKQETAGLRGYWRNLDLDYLPGDMSRFIRANTCDSAELRRFEKNLARAVDY